MKSILNIGWVILATGLFLAAAWVAAAFFLQRSLLFPAPAPPIEDTPWRRSGADRLWLESGGSQSEAWWLPPLTRLAHGTPVLLFAHGNGELIDSWASAFDEPRRWGLAVFLVEYPGYGRSDSTPSEASITAAMTAAYDRAVAQPGVNPTKIVAYGRSLGGGAACALARHRHVAALVLESTFTSVRSLALRYGLPGFLVRDPFDNSAALRSFRGPVLILHGTRDDLIPPAHAEALHAAAPHSRLELVSCGHNDCPRPWALLREFLTGNGLL